MTLHRRLVAAGPPRIALRPSKSFARMRRGRKESGEPWPRGSARPPRVVRHWEWRGAFHSLRQRRPATDREGNAARRPADGTGPGTTPAYSSGRHGENPKVNRQHAPIRQQVARQHLEELSNPEAKDPRSEERSARVVAPGRGSPGRAQDREIEK